jgi:TonB family protein
MRYPAEAAEQGNIQGGVTVRFIVEKNGNTLYPVPISGPEVFYQEVIRLIKKSHWNPAKIKGKVVNSYHEVTINFRLA